MMLIGDLQIEFCLGEICIFICIYSSVELSAKLHQIHINYFDVEEFVSI